MKYLIRNFIVREWYISYTDANKYKTVKAIDKATVFDNEDEAKAACEIVNLKDKYKRHEVKSIEDIVKEKSENMKTAFDEYTRAKNYFEKAFYFERSQAKIK
jgi:hypothetical protein